MKDLRDLTDLTIHDQARGGGGHGAADGETDFLSEIANEIYYTNALL